MPSDGTYRLQYGEGIPVAWAITNREDTAILMQFMKAIKCKVNSLEPMWFMSDDADQFFNAFRAIFGCAKTKKVLCAWHVDRSWRGALRQHIPHNDRRVEVYHYLRVLLMEREEGAFRVNLQKFLSYLDLKKESSFLHYFRKTYCNRVEQWAACYRLGTQANTNMFIETFHRLLKTVYLEQKQNRRIDFLVHTLLRISKDKAYERLQKIHKGKYSHRISQNSREDD